MNFEKTIISEAQAGTTTGPYSSILRAGPFLSVSGQRPAAADGTIPEGIEAQTRQCLENLRSQLRLAGADMKDVLRTHVFLADTSDFAKMNEVYMEMFPEPYPTRTTVGVQLRNILIEIECEAILPE